MMNAKFHFLYLYPWRIRRGSNSFFRYRAMNSSEPQPLEVVPSFQSFTSAGPLGPNGDSLASSKSCPIGSSLS